MPNCHTDGHVAEQEGALEQLPFLRVLPSGHAARMFLEAARDWEDLILRSAPHSQEQIGACIRLLNLAHRLRRLGYQKTPEAMEHYVLTSLLFTAAKGGRARTEALQAATGIVAPQVQASFSRGEERRRGKRP